MFAVVVAPTPFTDLPTELTAEWQVTDLTAGVRDTRIAAILPRGARSEVAFAGRHFAWPPANDPRRPPYRGQRPLEADAAGIFFGREAPVVSALDHLRGLREAAPPRLMVILGASGSCKSSFPRAGLVPRLARDDRNLLLLPIVRPERAAISGEAGLLHALEGAKRSLKLSVSRAELRTASPPSSKACASSP